VSATSTRLPVLVQCDCVTPSSTVASRVPGIPSNQGFRTKRQETRSSPEGEPRSPIVDPGLLHMHHRPRAASSRRQARLWVAREAATRLIAEQPETAAASGQTASREARPTGPAESCQLPRAGLCLGRPCGTHRRAGQRQADPWSSKMGTVDHNIGRPPDVSVAVSSYLDWP